MLLINIWTCHNMLVLVLVLLNFKMSQHLTFPIKQGPHLKKWYKKGYLGVLNCMLGNVQVAWNLSCKIPGIIITKLNNQMWRVCVEYICMKYLMIHLRMLTLFLAMNQNNLVKNGKVSAQDIRFVDSRQALGMD